ncbi:MAG: hypothetical protein KF763_19875 [Cyclobacteriaceae bacterium]|nr:hypothetical protein [Cyclobacteriaceae bacterium]
MDVTEKFYLQLARTELFYTIAKEMFDKEEFLNPLNKQIEKYRFFKNTIGHMKPFDIKQPGKGFSEAEIGRTSIFEGNEYDWTAYGNINYGYAARIFGISLDDALTAAGLQQVFGSGEGNPDWSNWEGMFDEQMDTDMINMGFNFIAPWGQIALSRFIFIVLSSFTTTASCQRIDHTSNMILFIDNESDVIKSVHRMEFFMNKFPKTFMVNYFIDNDGYLYLNNQKVAPIKGAVTNPLVRKDMVFHDFSEDEIDEFFNIMAFLMQNGIESAYMERSTGKFFYPYKSKDVRSRKNGRDLMIVSQKNDTTSTSFISRFKIIDRKGDLILIGLKEK